MTPSIVEEAEALARQWERNGHPLTNPEIAPVILFDPAARETVLLAVESLNAETAQSFLHALADCPPLADFGLQALSRRADAKKEVLEQVLSHFLALANAYDIPKHGLHALTVAKNPSLTTWAIDSLLGRWDSVKGEDAWYVHRAIANVLEKLFASESIDSLLSRWDSVKGEDAWIVQEAIANALGAIGDSRAIDSLLSRWDSIKREDAEYVHQAIVNALETKGVRAVPSVWRVWRTPEKAEEKRKIMESVLFTLGTFSPEVESKEPTRELTC